MSDILRRIFTKEGNFNYHNGGYDPYRVDEEHAFFHSLIFEKDGSVKENIMDEIERELSNNPTKYRYDCDLLCVYHGQKHGSRTRGAYPAVYYWR